MSANSPPNGRILRSHARKPSEDNKEKGDVTKQQAPSLPPSTTMDTNNNNNITTTTNNTNLEKEKEKKKRKAKHSFEAEQEDIKPSKSMKKKRKIGTRTAHSDGEQEYVELDTKSKVWIILS